MERQRKQKKNQTIINIKMASRLSISSLIREQIKMVTILKERNPIQSKLPNSLILTMLHSKKKDSQMTISLANLLERLKQKTLENTHSLQVQMMDQDFGSTERNLLKTGDSMEQEKEEDLLNFQKVGTISKPLILRMVVVHQWLFRGKVQTLKIRKNFSMDHMKIKSRK